METKTETSINRLLTHIVGRSYPSLSEGCNRLVLVTVPRDVPLDLDNGSPAAPNAPSRHVAMSMSCMLSGGRVLYTHNASPNGKDTTLAVLARADSPKPLINVYTVDVRRGEITERADSAWEAEDRKLGRIDERTLEFVEDEYTREDDVPLYLYDGCWSIRVARAPVRPSIVQTKREEARAMLQLLQSGGYRDKVPSHVHEIRCDDTFYNGLEFANLLHDGRKELIYFTSSGQ